MAKLEYDPKISLGNIVTIALVLLGAVTAWNTVVSSQAQLAEKVSVIETALGAHEGRIRAVEIAQASQQSDLRAIQNGITRIEAQLEKLQPRQ